MNTYQWHTGEPINLPLGKVVCVGRNYVAHAEELNNPVPEKPLLFIKPATSLVAFEQNIALKKALGDHHYEAELALLVGNTIDATSDNPLRHICGLGLALDLTLREVQAQLKAQGHPWERAKAYDGSCPISPFVRCDEETLADNIEYRFWQNGLLRQHGESRLMIFSMTSLLQEISQYFTLMPGDIVLTGTPQGVGRLTDGDALTLQLENQQPWQAQVQLS